jgi:hypothetical protein
VLWNKIEATHGTSGSFPNTFLLMYLLFVKSLRYTTRLVSDERPFRTAKAFRSVGVVAKATWTVVVDDNPSPFSGLFRTGADYVLMRFSQTQEPEPHKTWPGISIKIFIDGKPSVNVGAMETLSGQSSCNFFEKDFSNHLPPPETVLHKLVTLKFRTVSRHPQKWGIKEWATLFPNGTTVDDKVRAPYRLIWRPRSNVTDQFEDCDEGALLEQMESTITPGTVVYDLFGVEGPEEDSQEWYLGFFTVTGPVVRSAYADRKLFFRHQKFEDDLNLRPEWKALVEETIDASISPACPIGYGQAR